MEAFLILIAKTFIKRNNDWKKCKFVLVLQ